MIAVTIVGSERGTRICTICQLVTLHDPESSGQCNEPFGSTEVLNVSGLPRRRRRGVPQRWQHHPGGHRCRHRDRLPGHGRAVPPGSSGRARGHREHEVHRPSGPRRRAGLPDATVQDPGRLRRLGVLAPVRAAWGCRGPDRPLGLLPPGRRFLGGDRLHGHVVGREGQHARGRCSPRRGPRPGDAGRLPYRWCGGYGDRRSRPAGRRRGRLDLPQRRPVGARGLRFRCRAAGDVHACRWRHLHQGR